MNGHVLPRLQQSINQSKTSFYEVTLDSKITDKFVVDNTMIKETI